MTPLVQNLNFFCRFTLFFFLLQLKNNNNGGSFFCNNPYSPERRRNVVSLNCGKLDLKARNAEYNPRRLPAVIMRIREPKTTALIFATGKIVCTGAKSENDSKLAARKYARIVQKLGYPGVKFVASCDVRFPIRLEGLAIAHSSFSSYEPEIFPGLVYRMKKPKIVLLVFASGKIVITGAKVRDDIYAAFDNIYPVLTQFTKKSLAMS